jgi:hypothetical protein
MTGRRAGIAMVTLLLGATGVRAQDHRVAFAAYVGSASFSDMASNASAPVILAPGAFTGGQAELWFQRFGVRLNGGVSNTAVDGDPGTGVRFMAADVDLMARLRWPRPGLFFQPYTLLGAGAVRYDIPDATSLAGEVYESNPTTRGSLVLGIGTDLGSGPVAARIELMDIIGTSSPLTRSDGSRHGAVQHVVLTFGVAFRAGHVALSPRPEPPAGPGSPGRPTVQRPPTRRPPPVRTPPSDTDRPEGDEPVGPRPAPPNLDPAPATPPAADSGGKVVPARPIPEGEPPAVDTAGLPVIPARPIPTPESPPDPADPGDPAEPADPGEVHGRLFTVRIGWDQDRAGPPVAARRLADELAAAGLPVWPVSQELEDGDRSYQRLGALRNASDARTLGMYIQSEWGLDWSWVHIDREDKVPAEAVEASHAFVDGLDKKPRVGKRASGPPSD